MIASFNGPTSNLSTEINSRHALCGRFARIDKALTNSNRLEIIEYLAQD